MRLVLFVCIALVVGAGLGSSAAYRELTAVGEIGLGSPLNNLWPEPRGTSPSSSALGAPRVEVIGSEVYDFGSMELGATQSHAFRLVNRGDGPLKLEAGETTCKCTLSDLEHEMLAPGESTEVVLEWTPKAYEAEFVQSAEIFTNDPSQPVVVLNVRGRVTQAVRPEPAQLSLGSVSANDTAEGELAILAYQDEPLEIVSLTWASVDTADNFTAEIVPLPEDQVAAEPGAKGGRLIRVTMSPGLPLGPLQQTLRVETNHPRVATLEVPITATIVSDISLLGRGLDRESNTLLLGSVSSRQGESVRLNVMVKGPHTKGFELEVEEVWPGDLLEVEVGEVKPLKEGAVLMIPVTVAVPAGARPANHLAGDRESQGKVILRTNHPQVAEVPIYVRFAVE